MEFQHLAGLGQQNLLPHGLEAGSLRQAGVSTARSPVKPAWEGPFTSGGGQPVPWSCISVYLPLLSHGTSVLRVCPFPSSYKTPAIGLRTHIIPE